MLLQQSLAHSFQSPIVRIVLVVIAIGLLYVLWREVRKIPAKLLILMATAFIDMLGVLMIFPLLPFYVKSLGGAGIDIHGFHLGIGIIAGFIIASFTLAQLLSAPLWGKFSDRVGRRPTLLIALSASAVAYLIFGFADSLFLLFLSRIVQGAGGGTVGVIQAYVADSTAPEDRARALGWLSATTNLGVTLGPVLGSFAITLGKRDLMPGPLTLEMGHAAPGIFAAALCLLNIAFAARYLTESRDLTEHAPVEGEVRRSSREAVARHLAFERDLITSDLDLCDRDGRVSRQLFRTGAVSQRSLSSDGADHRLLLHVRRLDLRVYTCAIAWADGRLAWRSETLARRVAAARYRRDGNATRTKHLDARDCSGADSTRDRVHISLRDGAAVARHQSEGTRTLHGDATDVWWRSSNHRPALFRLDLRHTGRIIT